MTWKEAHRLAMLAAGRLHRQLEIDQSHRIDIFGVIERLGLLLAFRPLARTSGAYIHDAEGSSGVVINANEPQARQRYTAAHELGHHVFEHGTTVDEEASPANMRARAVRSDREKLAEAFAEWFLMPRQLVQSSLDRMNTQEDFTAVVVYNLSLRLGTSYDATARHLGNLRLATGEEVKGWLATPPKRIKQALARGVTLADWRRDVWEVTVRDRGSTISVYEGDRLVVALEEIPTSGYLWEWLDHREAVNAAGDGYGDRTSKSATETLFSELESPAGSSTVHWFALDVGTNSSAQRMRLDFTKRRPWRSEEVKDRFDILVEVEHPRLGVREDVLALSGS